MRITAYCHACEAFKSFDSDGYCLTCGYHANDDPDDNGIYDRGPGLGGTGHGDDSLSDADDGL